MTRNAAIGYQGMHLPYLRGQLEEVDGEVRRLIRGYEGIPTEVPWCVLRSLTAYYGAGIPTVKPVWIPIGCSGLFLSHFRDFSNFRYNFRRILKLYHL